MGKRIMTLIFVLILSTVSLLAQGDDRIERILGEGLQPVTLGEVVFEPDFSADDGGEGWDSADTSSRFLGIDDAQYRVENTSPASLVRGLYEESFDNTVLVVETTQLSDELDNGYGVVCRADPTDELSGYIFFISGDGYARIFTYDGFDEVQLAGWSVSSDIVQGQSTNEIIAVCVNDYLALYINGELALEAESDLYTEGSVGFVATTFVDGTSANIAYDNLRVFSTSGDVVKEETEVPQTLENFDGEWQDAVAELEATGLISSGGQLIFEENRAFMDSTVGANFYPLASRSSYADVVFSGTVNITLPSEGEMQCGFLSRVQLDDAGEFTIGGFETVIINQEAISVYTFSGDDGSEEILPLDVEADAPVHILYILQNNRATVYIDGELLITDFLINDAAGFHGILLRSEAAGGRCEGENMWAYYAPVFEAGVCDASSSGDVNQRSGPGTTFERAGTLPAGTVLQVIGQSTGADGLIWWQLENDNWVREDVVNVVGDCANVPEVDG
ncbi:MAG: SH3 domain-containing protein [Aggregatilineales bacterium]